MPQEPAGKGSAYRCDECSAKRNAAPNGSHARKRYNLGWHEDYLRLYAIGEDDYNWLRYERQGNLCAARGCEFGPRGREADVEHDNSIGNGKLHAVRGIVCHTCNVRIMRIENGTSRKMDAQVERELRAFILRPYPFREDGKRNLGWSAARTLPLPI